MNTDDVVGLLHGWAWDRQAASVGGDTLFDKQLLFSSVNRSTLANQKAPNGRTGRKVRQLSSAMHPCRGCQDLCPGWMDCTTVRGCFQKSGVTSQTWVWSSEAQTLDAYLCCHIDVYSPPRHLPAAHHEDGCSGSVQMWEFHAEDLLPLDAW